MKYKRSSLQPGEQRPPLYAQAVQQHIDRAAREDDEDGEFDEEARWATTTSSTQASTSCGPHAGEHVMLQRRLRIGYNRAARIMELMEEKGVVRSENGSSPREILVDLDKFR